MHGKGLNGSDSGNAAVSSGPEALFASQGSFGYIGSGMTIVDLQPGTTRAQELYGDFWFNGGPLSITDLRGRVVLVHFWDHTCLRCQRTMPYIREWGVRYALFGLAVIGVHTPRFPFGRNPDEVRKAIGRQSITHPIAMDNEGLMAARYGSRTWPTLSLIDRNGFIRLQSVGEGEYASVERMIQSLLYDAGIGGELPLLMEALREEDRPGAVCYRATPELFTGYTRGTIGNVEGYSPEAVVSYDDPGLYLEGRFYAVGRWMNDRNSLRFTGGGRGDLVVSYRALEASAVLRSEGGKPFDVTVQQDDAWLNETNRGDDVRLRADGQSVVRVDETRPYSLVRNKEFGEHVLRLTTSAEGCAVYSFTFISSVIPDLVSAN